MRKYIQLAFNLSVIMFLFFTPCLYSNGNMDKSVLLNKDYAVKSSLIVSGKVVKKKEIWDRRTNKLMGRPDILKEIILHIKVFSVIKGGFLYKGEVIKVSLKSRKQKFKYPAIAQGESGIFYLDSGNEPFSLIYYEPSIDKSGKNVIPSKKQALKKLNSPKKISGRMIRKSEKLRKATLGKIAAKYKMKDAEIITMISFQGPRPPDGGYVCWGVKGKINGKWHVWQPGAGLRKGKKLKDFHKCQK